MLHWYTYLFPLACIVLIGIFFAACPSLSGVSRTEPGRDERAITRKDLCILLVIMIIYSIFAFYKLGSRTSPEQFAHFDNGGSVAEITFTGDPVALGRIRAFCGVNTGNYTLEVSTDGVTYQTAGTLEQTYSNIFKWVDADLSGYSGESIRSLRIVSDSDLYLGEVAVYDVAGIQLDTSYFTCSDLAAALFDEQETVPDRISYLNSSYFDEVYHARTAVEHMWNINPYEISHPPLGKIIISIGMSLFGITPFGWRFMGTVFGILMLPAIFVFLKKMFGGTAVPACGTILLASDFMHYVQTRIATVDSYAVFFIILMYLFMYLYLHSEKWRYLALCGVFFGLGAATKWICLYAGAGLGVLWLLHWILNWKQLGRKAFFKNVLFCILFFILVPGCIYYCSYYPYGTARGMDGGIGMYFTREYADIVLSNQNYMLTYHMGVNQTHPYSSRWYQWIFDIRPILYYLEYSADGLDVSSFGAWLNPVLCWGGFMAILSMMYLAVFRKDRTAGFIVIGYLAQLVPWIFISRTTFEYHYFASSIFLVLALAYIFDLMVRNRKNWKRYVYGFTALSCILFVAFLPCLTGIWIDRTLQDTCLGWLNTWPF